MAEEPALTAEEGREAGRTPTSAADARAAVEAQREQRSALRAARLHAEFGAGVPGRPTIWATWIATGIQAAVSVFALADEGSFLEVFLATTLVMFGLGSLLFVVDIVLAAARSTRDAMGIGGLFFAMGSAPRAVTLSLNAALVVAVVVSTVVAVVRLSTPELAFGTLAPILQLSLSGFWGVRHGLFSPREDEAAAGGAKREATATKRSAG